MTRFIRKFFRKEDGTFTIEFVMWVPFMLVLLTSVVESSMFMTRWMLLDRALDLAVRDLRINTYASPSFEEFRGKICEEAHLPDCMDRLQIELVPVTMQSWPGLAESPNCIDRAAEIDPIDDAVYTPGQANNLMTIRACALMSPMFANVGLGALLPKDENGEYQVLAFSAYVQEP